MTPAAASPGDESGAAGVPPAPAHYSVPIETLEAGVRVPLDALTESQPVAAGDDFSSTWNEAERQLRLAGAA